MNLLYVTAGLPFCRGETFIIPEIAALRQRGHVVVLAPVRPYMSVLHADANPLLPITVSEPLLSFAVAWTSLVQFVRHPVRVFLAALAMLQSRSALVLLKNIAVFPKGLWLARVASSRRVEHIHCHWASTSATAAFVAARVAGIPWSVTAHRWDISENNLLRLKARSASFVRAISLRGRDELRRYMGEDRHRGLVGRSRSKLVVIHVGVDLPDAATASPSWTGPLRVIMAAFLVEVKGHRYAIDAIAMLRRRGIAAELDLAGVGPLQPELEKYAVATAASSSVHFLGMMNHDDLLAGLGSGRWNVALLPSIVANDGAQEGIPVFLMEAMAAGVPVVAAATGGIPELVDGVGELVPERNAAAIADALERLYRDAKYRSSVAQRARDRVTAEFSVQSSVDALIEQFRSSGVS